MGKMDELFTLVEGEPEKYLSQKWACNTCGKIVCHAGRPAHAAACDKTKYIHFKIEGCEVIFYKTKCPQCECVGNPKIIGTAKDGFVMKMKSCGHIFKMEETRLKVIAVRSGE